MDVNMSEKTVKINGCTFKVENMLDGIHKFKLLPIQEQMDTIAYSWWCSAAVNALHASGVHVCISIERVEAFLKEYYSCDSTQLDKLLELHQQYKEENMI